MKNLSFALFLISSSLAYTQLDSADITPHAGDQYIIRTAHSFNGSIASGMNQVWDFTNLITPTGTDTVSCKPIDTNLVVIGGVGKLNDVQFEHSNSNMIEYLGLFSDRIQLEAYYSGPHVIGTQKQIFYEFPINFGNIYQSQFKFEATGEPWYQDGISYCSVDGFGDLHLPNGISYSDVYKIRMIKDGQTVYTFTYPYGIVEAVDTMHVWVKSGIGHPLLIIHTDNWVHDISASKVEYLSQYSTASIKNENNLSNLVISPNPSNGIITVYLPNIVKSNVYLYSSVGELIEKYETNSNQAVLNLSQLQPGMYLLKIEANGTKVTRKLIIE